MGAFDDLIPQSGAAGGAFDDLIPSEPPKKKRERTVGDIAGDVAVTAVKGAINLPQAFVGLADLASGGAAGKKLEELGYKPEEAKQILESWYSDAQKEANQEVRQAEGFTGTVNAALDNPSVIATTVGESVPMMLGGASIARGIVGMGVAPWLAGGIGEGIMGAGSAAEEIRNQNADGLLTGKQTAAAIASGLGTAAMGAAGGKLANKMGVPDVDTMLASGKMVKSPAGFTKAIVGAGISEGLFEELPQSVQEQMWQNYATDKPLTEGVGNAAALGLLSGAAMGGAGGGYNATMASPPQPAPAPAAPAPAPGQPPAAAPAAPAATAAPTNPATRLAELELTAEQRDLTDAERQEAATLYQQLTAEDEQDAPQGADVPPANEGNTPEAPADQAPQAVGREPAGPATGIPDEGSGYAVEASGVEPEPVDLTPKEVRTPNRDGSVTVSTWTPQPDGRMVRNVRIEPADQQADPAAQAPAPAPAPAPAAPGPIAATEQTEERILPPLEQGPDQNLQNRDRKRAASVAQMSDIARNPDYMRLGPSRTPDSGAPMVFAVSDDTKDIAPEAFGRQDVAVMSDGQQVPFRYAVVDASKVNPSNFADGRTNPDFSSSVPGTIKALNNGRTAGVRAAHEMGTSGQYIEQMKADAALHGIAPDVIARTPNPILVRVYSDADNTAGMAAKSQGQGLGMSPSELARQDAPLMDTSVLAVYQDGDITSAANRDFVRAFVGKLQGSGQDVAGMMTAEGELSQDGRKRIQAALMQAAYGDSDLVEEMFDSTDTDIKAIGEALKLTAGQWANMRDSARLAAINPEVDITENLLQVIGLIRKARRDRVALSDLVNQPDLMTGETPAQTTVAMLRLFYDGEHFTRAVGKDRLAKHLQDYVRAAMTTTADAGMFGDQVGPRDILKTFAPQGVPDAQAQPVNTGDEPGSRSPAGGDTAAGVQGEQQQQPAQSGRGPVESSGESGRGTGAGEGQQQAGTADQDAARDDDGAQTLVTPGYSELGAEPTQAERAAAAKLLPVGTVVRAKHMAEGITGEVTTSEPSDQYDDKRPYVVIRWSDGGKPRKLGMTNGSQAFIHGFFVRDGKLYTEGSPSSGMKAEWEVLQAAKPQTQPKADKPAPAKKPQKPAKGAAPREADHTGKPKDGNPVMPGDTFRTSSGRITTAYPKQQGAKYASQWLINNAVMEAESRGDSFNMRAFKATSPFKDGTLATADQESMLEYLFGQQPAVVPSILKPLTGKTEAKAERQPITSEQAGNMKPGDVIVDGKGVEYLALRARFDFIEVAPIVNGKPNVSADTTLYFHLRPDTASAYPNRRTDPVYATGRNLYQEQAAPAAKMAPEEAAKYLKDFVYNLGELEGMTDRAQVELGSQLGKSGRDNLLMEAFGLTREQAHDINNRLDARQPKKLRNVDMQDAFDVFPGLRKLVDDAIQSAKRRESKSQAKPTEADPILTAPTAEEVVARQDAAEAAQREQEAADRKAAEEEAKRREREEVRRRSDAAADTFELGMDPMANLTGQQDIFSAAPAPAPAVSANTIFTEDAAARARERLKKKLGQLNSGLDPEMMMDGITLAGYHIEKGARTFAAYARAMLGDLGDGVRPYLKSWYMGVKYDPRAGGLQGMDDAATVEAADVETITENDDVPGANGGVESDRGDAAAGTTVGDPVPSEQQGTAVRTGRNGGQAAGESGRGQQDRPGVPAGGAAADGERSDFLVPGGNATVDAADVAAGADFSERGSDIGFDGVSTDPVPATQVDAAAETGNDSLSKLQRQRAAEKVPVKPGDLDNIKATLPYLLEGQQEDVKKAEDRFAVPDGYGMLFTNGTGTGKTFTGLGVVKRLQRQGKTNTLIVVPDDKIAADWIESGEPLGLKITPLKDTKDAGSGITIATYANLGENDALATRTWDLVVADEAHSLMQSADGKVTTYLANLRAITHHPDGAYQRHTMLNRADIDKLKELSERIEGNTKILNNTDTMGEMMVSVRQENERLQREADALAAKLREASEAVRAEVASMQGPKRARLLALSATPFAYEFTVDWGNGYLFDYNEGMPQDGASGTGSRPYNSGSNRERFFMTHFGYSMRYNKLTKPDPSKVDTGLLQRNFNGWLRKKGSLSARMLDVPADYDRRFVLVDSGIGNQIDDALNWVSEMSREGENKNGFSALRDVINDKFDYLSRRYLLEAIKASEVVPIVRQHMAMGRKVVVFHDYKKGGGFNPFNIEVPGKAPEDFPAERLPDFEAYKSALTEFRAKFKSLVDAPLGQLPSPIEVFKREFPDVLLVNGDEKKRDLLARYKRFQDDASGPQVMLVQSAKNKGWSGHDTTGKHQRVLINLGQPTAPTLAIQQEGRIYRTGQVSNAIMRYLNTGTSWEKWTFASTIAGRASTAENLGMGEQARALKDAFIAAFEESDAYPPGHEGEGTGGKERDKLANADITAYDRAKTYYWATQKKNSKTKAQEGVDYFATPEPVGFKMAEWLQLRGGESSLEPSAGHGAIARWLPEITNRTVIEPSNVLRARLAMAMDASKDRIIDGRFEDHAIVNKYDGIVMNPPFGVGGKTAVEHLAKAATHLRDGGRIVALIPTGPAADKRFDQWMYGTEQRPVKPVAQHSTLGAIYVGDTITSRAAWAPSGKVVSVSDDGGVIGVKPDGSAARTSVSIESVTSIEPTGKRTREVRPADGIYTVGEIRLPQVTFERAGTAVATRIVILEKQTDKARAPNARSPIDLTGITDIKELFDRLEDINMPQRAMTAEQEAAAKAEEPKAPASKAEAKADKPKAANPEAVGTVDRGELPIVEHTTTKGKVIRGVIRTDLTKEQAQAIDPYTWKKDGGYFIREVYLKKDGAGESPAFSRQLPKFSRNAVAQSLSAVEADVSSMLKGLENPPNVVVAFDMNDPAIPAEVRAEDMKQRSGGASGSPEGFYYRGTAYIIASQMKSPADTARVFAHEVLGHYGLRTLFGKELKPILRQIIEARPQEVAAKLKEYGLRGVTDLDKMTAAEEVLAEMAQTKPELGFVKRAVAAIRTWLRNNVPGLKNLPLSDAEIIRNYILPARGWVERGERAMRLDGQVAFNRGAAVAFADIAAHFERYPSRPPSGMSSDEAKTYLRDRRASMEALVASYEPRAEGLLMPVRGNGGFWGVTREARPDGDEWRVTRFDQNMEPQGHEAHRSARDAVADVLNWVDVGRISQASMFSRTQDQTETEAFRRWFGDSKVVDADGKPLVVYHGTRHDFDVFDIDRGELGAHFGTKEQANQIVSYWAAKGIQGSRVMPAFLAIRNPLRLVDVGTFGQLAVVPQLQKLGILPSEVSASQYGGERGRYAVRRAIEKAGYDGVVYANTREGDGDSYIALRPEQIKSAIGNNGDFDAGNPDIRFSRSTMGGNPAPQPQQPNKWQQVKQRVMELTSGANIDKLIYEFQDKNIDLKRLRDHIKELGGTITDLNDAYLGEELFHKRVAKRTEDFLQEELRPLLADLRKRGVAMEAFERYLHARHAPEANKVLAERNPNQATIDAKKDETSRQVRALELQLQRAKAQGTAVKALEQALDMARAERARWIGAEAFKGTEEERLSLSGMTDAESAAILSGLNPREQADMEALAARVDAINTRTMDTLERYGLMDRTALDAWRNTYKFYIPLHRDEAHPDSVSHPIGQGFSTKGEASKRRTGSNAKVTNILGHIAMQRETALTRGEKNVVAKKLYLMAAQNPDPEYWEADKVPTQKVVDKDTGLVRTQVDPTYRNKPNVVMVRIAGKDHAIVFNERNPNAVRLAQSLKGQDIGDVDVVTNIVSKGTRWFASVNTQYNPLFGLVNFARDVQAAILQLSTTPLAGKEREVSANTMPALKGIYQEIRQRRKTGARGTGQWARLWEQMQDDGGTTGYRELFTKPDERVKQLTKELKSLDRGQASQLAHALVDWLSDYNEVMENAVRLSAYKTALDMGMSRERAASVAKNLTVNFNRRGRSGSKLGMWYAFLNASIQGTTRLVQTLRGPMGKKIMAGGVSLGAVSTMIGMAVMGGGDDGEDDNWAKIPDFVKERSLIIPLSHEDYITIPMPLGYNVLHNIGRKAVEMATHDDPTKSRGRHLADLARIVLDSFNPMGGSENLVQMLAPTVFDPAVALLQNRDWTGKPIYREDTSGLDPSPGHTRTKDTASTFSKVLSEAINKVTGGTDFQPGLVSWTPDQIDYVIGQLTGGVGRELMKVEQTVTAPLTGEDLPAHKIPLVGRLYGNTRGPANESEQFYENVRDLNGVERELKGRARAGEDVTEYMAENPLASLVGSGNAAERALQEMRAARREVMRQGGPGSLEQARQINQQMGAVMKELNRQVRQAKTEAQ